MRANSVADVAEVKSDHSVLGQPPQEQKLAVDNAPSDAAQLAGGGLIGLVGKIGGQGLGVLGNVIVARVLGPTDYGLYAIGLTIMRMAGLIAPLGLDKAVVYYATQFWNKDRAHFVGMLRQSIAVAMLSGALLGGLLFAFAPWLGNSVFHKEGIVPTLRWFAGVFVAYAGLGVVAAATTVSKRVEFSVLSKDILQPSIFIVLVLVLGGVGFSGVAGAILATLVSFVGALVAAIVLLYRLFPEAISPRVRSPLLVGRLLAFSIPSAFAGIFAMYMLWANRLLVGHFCSLEETGIYQAATQIALLLPMIQAAFTPILLPMTTDLYNSRDPKRLDELYKVSTKWALYLSMPFLLVVLVMPREVITALFSSRYAEGWLPLLIIVAAQAVNIGTGPVGPLLVMTGHQRRWSIISGGGFLLNLGFSAVLIPRMGITGAALGLAVAYAGMFLIGVREIKRSIGVWPYDGRYLKGGVGALLTAGGLLALRWVALRAAAQSPFVLLLLGAVLSVSIFGGYLFWRGFDEEDLEFLRLLRDRFSKMRRRNG